MNTILLLWCRQTFDFAPSIQKIWASTLLIIKYMSLEFPLYHENWVAFSIQ